jgi:hypothetical protein
MVPASFVSPAKAPTEQLVVRKSEFTACVNEEGDAETAGRQDFTLMGERQVSDEHLITRLPPPHGTGVAGNRRDHKEKDRLIFPFFLSSLKIL